MYAPLINIHELLLLSNLKKTKIKQTDRQTNKPHIFHSFFKKVHVLLSLALMGLRHFLHLALSSTALGKITT